VTARAAVGSHHWTAVSWHGFLLAWSFGQPLRSARSRDGFDCCSTLWRSGRGPRCKGRRRPGRACPGAGDGVSVEWHRPDLQRGPPARPGHAGLPLRTRGDRGRRRRHQRAAIRLGDQAWVPRLSAIPRASLVAGRAQYSNLALPTEEGESDHGSSVTLRGNVEWRRSHINRAAHDLPPGWVGVTQFPTAFFVQRPNPGPAGRRAAHLRSVAGQGHGRFLPVTLPRERSDQRKRA
jgi:hypothetical protein